MGKNWRNTYNQYKNLFWRNYNYYKEKESFKNFIELFLTLTTIIILVVFAIKPTAVTIIEVNKEIKAKEETLKKMNIKIRNLQKAQETLSQQQEIVSLINRALPSEPDPEVVLRQIEAASNESGSTVKSISISSEVPLRRGTAIASTTDGLPSNTGGFDISLSLNGNYEDLMKAVETYENLARVIILKQMNLSQNKQEEGASILTLSAGIVAPYYSPQSNTNNNKGKENNSNQPEENILEGSK